MPWMHVYILLPIESFAKHVYLSIWILWLVLEPCFVLFIGIILFYSPSQLLFHLFVGKDTNCRLFSLCGYIKQNKNKKQMRAKNVVRHWEYFNLLDTESILI